MVERTVTPAVIPALTQRSREWAEYFREQQVEQNRRLYAVALGRILPQVVDILREEITDAIDRSNEYIRYQWMRNDLIARVCVNDVIALDTGSGRILFREGLENLGGSWEEFWYGVEAAREDLKSESAGKPTTLAQRMAFWANKVWPSEYYYPRTMAIRRSYWGDKTPWWLWLDAGNADSTYAFPKSAATHFVDRAEARATELLEITIEDMYIKIENVIYQAMEAYMSDPESYAPFDILAEFYEEGRAYEVYLTEYGRIGTRLQ